MDERTCRRICQLVAGLVITDDVLDEQEEAFLDRVMQHFGISGDRDEVILPLVDAGEAVAEMKKLPPAAQREALDLLVKAAAADGQIAREEQAYLNAIGDAMGIAREDLQKRLDRALDK